MALVGDQHISRIHVLGGHAEMAEGESDNVAGEPFAVARDGIDGARREFAEHGQPFHQFGEFLEMLVEEAVEVGAVAQGDDQARLARMVVAEIVKLGDVFLALPPNRGGRDGQQLIGGLPHGGNHHHGTPLFAGAHDAGNTLDGGGGLH